MKEKFIEKRFGSAAETIIRTANEILDEYAKDGYDLSLRQLYYQFVSRNLIENTERSYKNLGSIISDARLAGRIDWDMIKDRGREMISNPHWTSPADILETCSGQYRIDRWGTQPNYIEVMVEKQALEGVLIPVCKQWDVPFTANKGYSSSSAMYEASRRYLRRAEQGKGLYILYLGDHDPSGIDMTRDVDDRFKLFLNQNLGLHESEGLHEVQRLALNMDQIKKFKSPENPAKLTDSRSNSYIKKFGRSSWELDAIEPKRLAKLVSDAIAKLVDKKAWQKSGEAQQAGRNYIKKIAEEYNDNHNSQA
jgi:hypothetical protein